MKNKTISLIKVSTAFFIAIIMSSLFSMNTHADEYSNGAKVSDTNGYVTVTDSEGNVKRLSNGDTVSLGDSISTGNDSSVELILPNGQIIALGELQNYTFSLESIVAGGSGAPSNVSGGQSLSRSSNSLSTSVSAGGSPTN